MTTQDEPMLEAHCSIDKQAEHLLGTPINVVFSFRNHSPHPISFAIGNGRTDGHRFAAGPNVTALDPYYELGGLAEIRQLEPERGTSDELLLNGYLHFTHPGHYTVTWELDIDVTDSVTGAIRRHTFREHLSLDLIDNPQRQRAIQARLVDNLNSQDPQRQLTASYILSELRDSTLVPDMARGLKGKNEAVVENLLRGLGRVDSDEAQAALRDFAASSTSPRLQTLAREQLTQPAR